MKLKYIISSTLLAAVVAFVAAAPLSAQTAKPNGLTMSPVSYVASFRPGEAVNTGFTLTNDNSSSLTLQLTPAEIANGQLSTAANSAAGWTKVDQTSVTLAPAQSTTVNVTVSIPANATTGAYYPAVLVTIAGADNQQGSGTNINADLSFQMGIDVTAEIPTDTVKVTKLIVNSPVLTGTATVSYEITNPLTLFIKPIGYLQILNSQGQQVYHSTINESLTTLGPGQKLSGDISVSLPQDVTAVGQYHAELLVLDQQFSTADIMKTDFLVLPIWIPIGVVVALVLVGTLGKGMMGKRKKTAKQ